MRLKPTVALLLLVFGALLPSTAWAQSPPLGPDSVSTEFQPAL